MNVNQIKNIAYLWKQIQGDISGSRLLYEVGLGILPGIENEGENN